MDFLLRSFGSKKKGGIFFCVDKGGFYSEGDLSFPQIDEPHYFPELEF